MFSQDKQKSSQRKIHKSLAKQFIEIPLIIRLQLMNKDDFMIYYLLYAIDMSNVKKQNLAQIALKTDTMNFVRIYNIIQQHDESTRKSIIESSLKKFDRNDLSEEIKNTFLTDLDIPTQDILNFL